jgi:pimeloyl-ACP methyl ester carboxylesterase
MSKLKLFSFALLIGLIIVLAGFAIWAENPLGPMPEALAALDSNGAVRVETDPWLEFWPQDRQPSSGVILYPGGRVDPRAYAPAARALAEEGSLAVITPMPLNLAFFDMAAAADVMAAYPQIETWIVGGHSLGGVAASTFASGNAGLADGLFFWASYPTGDALAGSTETAVTSIYATNDGLTTLEDIEASRANLPAGTRWVEIVGGNHAQFGWYGDQPGDGQAVISRQEQQEQVIAATAEMLEMLEAQAAGR